MGVQKYINRCFLVFIIIGISINVFFAGLRIKIVYQQGQASITTAFEANPYKELQDRLDKYLQNKQLKDLQSFQNIAVKIQQKTGDNFPVDLYSFYKSINKKELDKFALLRKERAYFDKDFYKLDPTNRETKLFELRDKFLSLGASLEADITNIYIARHFSLEQHRDKLNAFVEEKLTEANQKQYLYLKAYFFLFQQKNNLGNANVVENLETILTLCKQLQLKDLEISTKVCLAAIYEINTKLDVSEKLADEIIGEKTTKPIFIINAHFIKSLTLIGKNQYNEALENIRQAQGIANTNQDHYNLALGYLLKAIVEQRENSFDKSLQTLDLAEMELLKSSNTNNKGFLLTQIIGERAENYLLKRDDEKAHTLYLSAIEGYKQEKYVNNYLLSWLYYGASNSADNSKSQNIYFILAQSAQKSGEIARDQPISPLFDFSGN